MPKDIDEVMADRLSGLAEVQLDRVQAAFSLKARKNEEAESLLWRKIEAVLSAVPAMHRTYLSHKAEGK
jgi:hypothetical protein